MRIVRLELSLVFDEHTKAMTPAQRVFNALGGQIVKVKAPREHRTLIRDEKRRFAVRWEYDSCGILFEDVDNPQDCFGQMAQTLETINGVVPIGNLTSRAITMYWILPISKYDFGALEQKYRQVFIRDNELFQNCIDSSTIVEMKYDNYVLHHQSGAMEITQLQRDYQQFKIKEGYPSCFFSYLLPLLTEK